MRTLFWIAAAGAALVSLLGWLLPSPTTESGLLEDVNAWYTATALISTVLGVVVGFIANFLARRGIVHWPHQAASVSAGQVRTYAVGALVGAGVVVALWSAITAATYAALALSTGGRIALLMLAPKFVWICACGIAAAAVAYAASTRFGRPWAGSYALGTITPAPRQ